MLRVPKEVAKAAHGLSDKAVHDVRVALRRCRSMADGLRAMDPDNRWKKMRRQAKDLFDQLGALRDCHVMLEWVQNLGQANDPVTGLLKRHLQQRESVLKRQAQGVIEAFDLKQWNQWAHSLPQRAAHLPVDSEAFQALALEKLISARRSQTWALKTGSISSLHRLRIAVKKFRYVVENFLPTLHKSWEEGLRKAQDLLGEIHDLDVLQQTMEDVCTDVPSSSRGQWRQRLSRERAVRIQRYRDQMSGEESLWSKWRSALPRSQAARHASLKRLQAWSSFLESDVQHSRRVARFAVDLYDGLERAGICNDRHRDNREMLRAAATVHEVGRSLGDKKHHKKTMKMVVQLRQLAGWTRQDIATMAQIARFHRGTLPHSKLLRDIPPAQRKRINLLAGVLRLANAFDADHSGSIQRFRVVHSDGFVTVFAVGLAANSALAETIAGARHLLETACRVPILVQPMPKRRIPRKL